MLEGDRAKHQKSSHLYRSEIRRISHCIATGQRCWWNTGVRSPGQWRSVGTESSRLSRGKPQHSGGEPQHPGWNPQSTVSGSSHSRIEDSRDWAEQSSARSARPAVSLDHGNLRFPEDPVASASIIRWTRI